MEEQAVSNNLLKEKLGKVENELNIEKSNFKCLEAKYNELKKVNKKPNETDKQQKTVNTNKNMTVANNTKNNVGNSNLKTMESHQQNVMSSYININSDVTTHENQDKIVKNTNKVETPIPHQNYESKTAVYMHKKTASNTLNQHIELANDSNARQVENTSNLHSRKNPLFERQSRIIIGTKTQSDSKFKAVERTDLIWLHVSKFKPQLSSMELESYLKLNLDSEDIIVKKLTRNSEKALFSSF